MARDYLAIPGKYLKKKFYFFKFTYIHIYNNNFFYKLKKFLATSIPIERAFSGGTDLITQKRCCLSAKTIQACLCLKSWWKFK